MSVVIVSSGFGAQENKICHYFHCFPFYLQWSDGTRCHDFSFLNAFKPVFPLSSFTLVKRLLSSSSLSAIEVVSSAYLRSLIFLLAILVPACDSSSPAFHMIYSAQELNKQGDSIQPWLTPFPVLNQSAAPCPLLTVAKSWSAYRFLRRQGKVVWYSHLFQNFPQFVVFTQRF